MASKQGDDKVNKDMILDLEKKVEKVTSEMQKSGLSASTSSQLQNLSKELQKLLDVTKILPQDPTKEQSQIRDELDKIFDPEEVGYSCDLCQRDLATDPERPNATLRSLQEACVLACGHVYHFKCLKGTTLDLDNHSADPSCIFCIS